MITMGHFGPKICLMICDYNDSDNGAPNNRYTLDGQTYDTDQLMIVIINDDDTGNEMMTLTMIMELPATIIR